MTVKVRQVLRPPRTFEVQSYLPEVLRGLAVTFRHFFRNLGKHLAALVGLGRQPGAVTIAYPEAPAWLGRRARTRHRLLRRPDGSPRCTACLLCETICPAECIRITAEESPHVMVEKRAATFEIDIGVCVFCGHCVEACPVDAIRMDVDQVELCAFSRRSMIWDREALMKGLPSRPDSV